MRGTGESPGFVRIYAYQFYNYDLGQYLTAGYYATREQIDKRNAAVSGAGVKPWLLLDGEYLEVEPSEIVDGFYYKTGARLPRSARAPKRPHA